MSNSITECQRLLAFIDEAECELREKREALLELQHQYLERVGFTIEPLSGGFPGDNIYRRGEETFIDVDHAMEYAEFSDEV